MRASEAWRKYVRDNGVENLRQLISWTDKYKAKHTKKNLIPDPIIGCILLNDPEFFKNIIEIQNMGGAIGQGLPVAIGAAVACPENKDINLQAWRAV